MPVEGGLRLARRDQLVDRELSQGLEQREPGAGGGGTGDDHGRVDQRLEQVEDPVRCDVGAAAHRLGGPDAGPVGEHAEAAEHEPLLLGQRLVAPLDRGAERVVTVGQVGGVQRERVEAVVQPLEQLVGSEGAEPGRRELEREWESVEPAGEVRQVLRGAFVEGEVGADAADPVDQQLDRR